MPCIRIRHKIVFGLFIRNDVKFIQASIYDSNGKLLLSSAADVISISQLHAGIYAVLLQTNKGEVRKRFAVVK